MGGNIEGTQYIEYRDTTLQRTVTTDSVRNDTSSIQIFNANLPKVLEITPQDLPDANTENAAAVQTRNLDISELAEKYEDNPIAVLKELGIEFSDKQIAELEKTLKDKKHLQAFLTIVDKANLNPDDIMAAVKKSKEFKSSNIFRRGWNVLKTAFTDGFSEAKKLAKSERVYYSERLSTNMSTIRKEREDFSSEGLANVADVCVQKPEIADETMHFVTVKSEPGKHAYTESDVLSAAEFMSEKPNEAETFLANAQELESIKDENGRMKYQGSTIIKVDKRMVNNKELQPTMMKTAKKHDMTDEYLDNITYNLEQNPEMQGAIEYSLDAKNSDGTDRFTANSINTESNHLVDKNADYCASYTQNLQELSRYSNLNSEDIVTVANNVTSHPEIKNEVVKQIKNGTMSGKEVAEYSNVLTESTNSTNVTADGQTETPITTANSYPESTAQTNNTTESTNTDTKTHQKNVTNPVRVLIKPVAENEQSDDTTDTRLSFIDNTADGNISEENYYRMYNYFGTMTDAILAQIKKDPSFIDVIKACNGDKTILQAQLNNPNLVNKIRSASRVSNSELSDILKICTDTSSTNVMLAALESGSVNQAIKTTRQSKITNTKQDALDILTSTESNSYKQNELNQLYGVGANREFVC